MKKALPFIFIMFSIALHAQNKRLNELVQQLNDKTQASVNIHGNSVFYSTVTFDANGFTETFGADSDGDRYKHPENDSSTITIRWRDLEDAGVTDAGRASVSVDSESGSGYFITPKSNVSAQELVDIIREIYKIITGYPLKERVFKDVPLANADQVIENSIASTYLEITGRSSGIISGTPEYGSNEHPYNADDLRLIFSFGKRFRFDMGILGYSWMDLPAYNKYDASGTLTGSDSFYSGTSFWTPSLGFTYAFMIEPGLGEHVILEFPVSVSFAPMLFGSNSSWDDGAESGDTTFEDLFAFSYIGHGSLGATLYLSKEFGISLKGGVYYFGVNATSDAVKRTNSNGVAEEYTIKFDEDESNIKPFLELGLKFRLD